MTDEYEITEDDLPKCGECGKPRNHLEPEFGYFCEDRCALDNSKDARKKAVGVMQGLFDMLGIDEDVRDGLPGRNMNPFTEDDDDG